MPYKDPVKNKEYLAKRIEDLKQHAINSIKSGTIIDKHKWDMLCNQIKNGNKKHPFSPEFTNDIIFDMMLCGCFYCGDIALTIDRKVSTLDHTPDNCVASCYGCNISKGVADSSTFIRKAYFRARGNYIDDITNIWFINKQKPSISIYKIRADKKGTIFNLNKEEWDILIKDDCAYCNRSPNYVVRY